MQRIWWTVVLAGLLAPAPACLAQPVVRAVVNGASFEAVVSPGCLVSIFGEKLAQSTVIASPPLPLPNSLGNTTVRVDGRAAPLYFVSPDQINAQLPFESSPGRVNVVVTTAEGQSNSFPASVAAVSPGIFTRAMNGLGQALYFDLNFQLADLVGPNDILIFYATGLGATDPPGITGAGGATSEPLQRVVATPEIWIGDVKADVAFAGLAPGFAGVYQVNVVAKPGLATDRFYLRSMPGMDTPVRIQSNIAEVRMQGGQNVANAQGTIQALYPAEGAIAASFSPLPIVAKFTARFDIAPNAGPFSVVAASAAAASTIDFDPAAGTFAAAVPAPSPMARAFDFAGSEILAIELLPEYGGRPMPGNIVPRDRIDLAVLTIFNLLPLPNTPVQGSSTWLVRSAGQAAAGSAFVIDDASHAELSTFAGFLPVPYNPGQTDRRTPLRLYIDGKLIASADVSFKTP